MVDVPSLRVFAAVVAVVALLAGCAEAPPVTVTFAVDGMTCESCSAAITGALEGVDGVVRADADHLAGSAEAEVLGDDVSDRELVAAIEDLGYTVTRVERADPHR